MTAAPGEAEKFKVVYGDDHLMVIDKTPDLVIHPAPSWKGETLVSLLAGRLEGGDNPERPGIVHRLDRGTSGLMMVAREDESHAALQRAIRERQVKRQYLALVEGRFRARTGTIDAPIGRAAKKRHRMAVNGASPRTAITHFEVEETLRRDSLLAVRLETGRTHQIRVHMAAIGHPVLGDATYGGSLRYGLERQFLHSAVLAFEHPVTGESMTFEAPLPADLQAALDAAREV